MQVTQDSLPYEWAPPERLLLREGQPDDEPCAWSAVLLVEDDAARAARRTSPGVPRNAETTICIRVHQIRRGEQCELAHRRYEAGELPGQAGRSAVALDLLDGSGPHGAATVVAAGTIYGSNQLFAAALRERGLDFVLELPPSTEVEPADGSEDWCPRGRTVRLAHILHHAEWEAVCSIHPRTQQRLEHLVARFGEILTPWGERGYLFVVQTGRVQRLQPGTIFALASRDATGTDVLRAISWTRWIRPWVRKQERSARDQGKGGREALNRGRAADEFGVRVNIKLSQKHDKTHLGRLKLPSVAVKARPSLWADCTNINVAELFSGGGGMGLGFLLGREAEPRYRIVFSGEAHPVYVETLRWNHRYYAKYLASSADPVPAAVAPLDLTSSASLDAAEKACAAAGGVHVLIGGPPCQGFSSANRNSWDSANPHNEMVDVFLNYVEALAPRVFLMENVQGIVWTPRESEGIATAAQSFLKRAAGLGYLVFPKVLDAVWYGVPQHRNRFFSIGILAEAGYALDDFGAWGPFPTPTHGPGTPSRWVTVADAIGDLPQIGNGYNQEVAPYDAPDADRLRRNPFLAFVRRGAPSGIIWDHTTSRHAEYVIERFHQIGQGDNWSSVRDMFTNYADVERTHSNIYRRLDETTPSITIGHYRKSMLIHPRRDRGLSLREACRLQSFPDWFRFIGRIGADDDVGTGGLTHKQQQLANAVCPLVTKAIAEFIAIL